MKISELTHRWRARAEDLQRFAPAAAEAFRECAEQLAAAMESVEETVSLPEASRLGGYTVEYLQRLVRAQKITNVGKKYRPRIRRADVPVKPGHLPEVADVLHIPDRRRIVAEALATPKGA